MPLNNRIPNGKYMITSTLHNFALQYHAKNDSITLEKRDKSNTGQQWMVKFDKDANQGGAHYTIQSVADEIVFMGVEALRLMQFEAGDPEAGYTIRGIIGAQLWWIGAPDKDSLGQRTITVPNTNADVWDAISVDPSDEEGDKARTSRIPLDRLPPQPGAKTQLWAFTPI